MVLDRGRPQQKRLNPLEVKQLFTKTQPGAGVQKPRPPLKPLNTPAAKAQPAPAPRRAPAPAAPAPSPYSTGGGGGGGGMQSFSAPAPAEPEAPAVPQVSDEDWLAGDSGFQAQLAALMRAMTDYEADNTAQRTKYDTDYNDAVKQLGWRQDDAATPDVNEAAWNFDDLNTASGRSFQNQQNDFASRGLLQSSLYGQANDNLTRSLNDQLGSVNTAKTNFFDELTRGLGAFKNENTMNQQQARAEALARRAATLGGIV